LRFLFWSFFLFFIIKQSFLFYRLLWWFWSFDFNFLYFFFFIVIEKSFLYWLRLRSFNFRLLNLFLRDRTYIWFFFIIK